MEGLIKDSGEAVGGKEAVLNENSNLWRAIRAGRWVRR